MKKRLKLPNGYGSVTERTDGRRRNPFIVKITIKGKQKAIGYVDSYEAGLAMLADYHRDPTRFITSNVTFAEVFRLMSAEKFTQIAAVTAKNYISAFNHCQRIHAKRFAELRPADLQQVITDAGANDLAIKKILGHAAEGVTKKVYTHKSLQQLRKAIDLL